MSNDSILFEYDSNRTKAENFRVWRECNRIERDAWGEKPLDDDEARSLFEELFCNNG